MTKPSMKTFADKIISFNNSLEYQGSLPEGIRVMNPFKENPEAKRLSELFYRKYYNDSKPRKLVLGINPGRFGAGATGIPFTDPKRLVERCEIPYDGKMLHEPSSVFVYEMISEFGGEEAFFGTVYISSVSPLGFTKMQENGKEKNFNYYDDKKLLASVLPFIKWNINKQINIAGNPVTLYCLGTGKNYAFLTALNEKEKYFKEIIPLEHPRFIVQYKQKEKQKYIDDYIRKLKTKE
jgi:hypothetical protein